ncbi:hypothetical protein SAMN02745784_02180 [Tissierella praeacuta DSM 18095]|uniref:Uncharacterized protein n=1 Tax=Tissierella praeacuta DSM 18095 TaxID=1123404 RepID=A0A1M4XA02_9FIRM|nr:hypothetical protein [Tissierella praeacuta]SHE90357.1 hypothetical protein SAMN02745784_02180 [Tissierella praeacuta DSM 18095]SUP02567.1 Uncharacterised protein [Tissierella praeacuta]
MVLNSLNEIKEYARNYKSQSHLCICNTNLFSDSINNGIYGFPHQGISRTKSFWRAIASMYNIGPHDLIFIYRTNGDAAGCKEIHGPFKIDIIDGFPAIFYELNSSFYPMKINNTTDCKVRFLFNAITGECNSISDNYELIKKFESKEIWGYRHPAVMNIGAARKKSVTSFTNKQTLLLIELLESFGVHRFDVDNDIPLNKHRHHFNSLNSDTSFRLDDSFLLNSTTNDEAFLYSYILRGLKCPTSEISNRLIQDFEEINSTIIDIPFTKISSNAMLETIISPHLQDELDIVLMDEDDSRMLLLEIKNGIINKDAIIQTIKYLDLLATIFPKRKVYANIIGIDKEADLTIASNFKDKIVLVKYFRNENGFIDFEKIW